MGSRPAEYYVARSDLRVADWGQTLSQVLEPDWYDDHAAGLAAQHQADTAVGLLALLLVLQSTFTLLALALRPYISAVLNCLEVACGCLEVAYLAITMATYLHTRGHLDREKRGQDAHLAVGACP